MRPFDTGHIAEPLPSYYLLLLSHVLSSRIPTVCYTCSPSHHLWNTYRSHSARIAFVRCNKHWESVEFWTNCKKLNTHKTHRIHQRRKRSQPQIPLIGSIFDCIGARKELWKMSRIVRVQYHSTTKTKTQEGRWWCWGWRDINFTDTAMAKRTIRLLSMTRHRFP